MTVPPPPDASPVEQALALSAARFDGTDAGDGEQGQPDDGEGQGDDIEASGAGSQSADKGEAPPADGGTPDFSHVPPALLPKLQPVLEDPEVAKFLKDGTLMRSRFTQLTTELAKERKALEEDKAKAKDDAELAALWREMESRPDVTDAVLAMLRKTSAAKPPPEPSSREESLDASDPMPDLNTCTQEEFTAWQARHDKRLLEAARGQIEAKFGDLHRKHAVEPAQAREAANAAISTWADENGLTEEQAMEAVKAAAAYARETGALPPEKWTAENVVKILTPFAPGARAAARGAVGGKSGGGAAGAAAPGRGGGKVVPPPKPASAGAGSPDPRKERLEEIRTILQEKLGRRLTLAEIEELG